VEIDRVLSAGQPATSPVSTPSAFALGDPAVTREVLDRAGFGDIEFNDVHEKVFYGPDVDTAYENVLSFTRAKELLSGPDADANAPAHRRLLDMLAAHHTGEGVLLDSRAWIVTARTR
jgi:hypothetical protein